MSEKQSRKISIDWPPERTIRYELRDENELDLIIPLEDNKTKGRSDEVR